ncbi:hypothetical protein APED_01295 [Acanthopleuribacter pedis]
MPPPSFTAPTLSRPSQLVTTISDQYTSSPSRLFPDLPDFEHWIADQYSRLPLRVEFVDFDPYRALEPMRAEVASTRVLQITTRHNESVFDPRINLMFRAVHDVDHIHHRCRFDLHGEVKACRAISARCGDEMGRALLFSEIVGQACVALAEGDFQQQKFVLFPLTLRDQVLRGTLEY